MNEWNELPPAMQRLATRQLFAFELDLQKPQSFPMPDGGERRSVGVKGGSFGGGVAALSGHIHPGGLDWVVIDRHGTARLDARLTLETAQGDTVLMSYVGIRHASPDVSVRIAQGLPVDPADYYFRITPQFFTTAPVLDWLNRVIAIGSGHRLPNGVTYSVFEVL